MPPTSRAKRFLKLVAIGLAKRFGPHLRSAAARRWLFHDIAPLLMDPAVLPPGLIDRPLKRVKVEVPCDPYVYVHRNSYWCGVFFEEELEAYLLHELRPGDTVIDVGVNVGHVALPAAALVRPSGQVLAFEPNQSLADLVSRSAARQGLPVRMHAYGLGQVAGSFKLKMDPLHLGGATFRATSDPTFIEAQECRVEVGDAVMEPLTGRVFLKIDVEGLELEVLHGLERTLKQVDHAVLEVSPEWIGAEGVETMFSLMRQAGLDAFDLRMDGRVGSPLSPSELLTQRNVVFRRSVGAAA